MSGQKTPKGSPDFEIIQPDPPSSLRDKVGSGDEIDPDSLARGEAAVAAMVGDFIEASLRDIETIKGLIADPVKCQTASEMIHELEGQGETFGYGLVTIIAGEVRTELEAAIRDKRAGSERALDGLRAMRSVLFERLTGMGGERGKAILASLGL